MYAMLTCEAADGIFLPLSSEHSLTFLSHSEANTESRLGDARYPRTPRRLRLSKSFQLQGSSGSRPAAAVGKRCVRVEDQIQLLCFIFDEELLLLQPAV